MAKQLTPDDRRRLAQKVGVHEATLYQAVTGKGRGFSPAECVRIERESGNELRRWDLRPNDWHLIWPELERAKGAPKRPRSAGAVARGPHEGRPAARAKAEAKGRC